MFNSKHFFSMTTKILNIKSFLPHKKFDDFPKNSINEIINKKFLKVKDLTKKIFESIIFQTSFFTICNISFYASFICFGSNIYLVAALISSITLAILIKRKFSDFLYELSIADSFIREIFFKTRWPWFNQITEHIFLGAMPLKNLNHEKIFKQKSITSILSIIEKKETIKKTIFTTPIHLSYWKKNNFSHLHIPIKDRHPIEIDKLQKAAEFIHKTILNNKKIYVHCRAGRARSAMAIIAYLLKYKKMNLNMAFRFIKEKRSVFLVNSSQKKSLKTFYLFINKP